MNTSARGRNQKKCSKNLSFTALAISALAAWAAPDSPCFASYHFMQIEKIVGGVNGDTTTQAIQLRMRRAGQQQVNLGKLIAWDQPNEAGKPGYGERP